MQSDDLGLVTSLTGLATQLERMSEGAAYVADGCVRVRDPVYLIEKLKASAAAIERLVAERDEAREALKPFAALYTESMRDYPDGTAKLDRPDDRQAWGFNNANLMWGDFRRARQALGDT